MKAQTIAILPIDKISSYILKRICTSLEHSFGLSSRLLAANPITPLSPGLQHEGKYNSTAALLYISRQVPTDTLKLLAVAQLDLYSPVFSYLYGEAQLGGTCALMSLYRLRQEFYNLEPDENVFLSRCEKEATHEIGHTFGLVHCQDKHCIMYPSSTIADTDEKSNAFCPRCSRLLNNNIAIVKG